MKAWVITLVLASVLKLGYSCSCLAEYLDRPRPVAIASSLEFSSLVYSARVIEARCNCYDVTAPDDLTCVQYTQGGDNAVTAQVVSMGTCDGQGTLRTSELNMCDTLNGALTVDQGVEIMPSSDSNINLTAIASSNSCPYICPANREAENINTYRDNSPCDYTVQVLEVFKPSFYNGSMLLRVFGPDVQTSCGDPSRRLAVGESYVVGVGGACSPINSWSTLDSYSDPEITLLRQLGGGAVVTIPSLLLLALVSLIGLSL